jgi:hypothetical protein
VWFTLRLSLAGAVILALLGGSGLPATGQDVETVPLPSPLTREGAVARVLAHDPRFADLPDWRDLRTEGLANFEPLDRPTARHRSRVAAPLGRPGRDRSGPVRRHDLSAKSELPIDALNQFVELTRGRAAPPTSPPPRTRRLDD